ncbi:MAG: 5-(carboxyamino)imidazole ribonucleotide mutase [Planctomycetota bacterium]|jgi:phosphoribosylaminoimidazole carboxylase PurE protein
MANKVAVIMGSDSDLPVMEGCISVLKEFEVPHEVRILSAHRTPDVTAEFAAGAESKGFGVIIAAAGGAAHLAGAVAAQTTLPVIGIPLAATSLGGFDALLSTVQMPPGIPVATVSLGKWGAKNAALLALEILALSDANVKKKLKAFRKSQTAKVIEKDQGLNP